MAKIVGGIATSHIPSIGKAIARGLYDDPYWKDFFEGFAPVHRWLDEVQPDVAVVVYNDHGLNFFLDKMPTFAVGAAAQYLNSDEGWGLPVVAPFPGDPKFSWHLIESLVASEFDITTCQEMLVDHAFTVPMSLLWPGHERSECKPGRAQPSNDERSECKPGRAQPSNDERSECKPDRAQPSTKDRRPVRTVPVALNTVQLPLPTPARCYKLGQALGKAIASFDDDVRVVIVGTGGLSHQLEGTRAGFINKSFDLMCLEKIVRDPEFIARHSIADLIREAGAQGVELIMWLVMRGALNGDVSEIHSSYHVPISNTASAVIVLDNQIRELAEVI